MKSLLAWAVFSAVFLIFGAACEVDAGNLERDAEPSIDGSEIDAGSGGDGSMPRLTWTAPERIVEVATAADERFPTISRGGLALSFARREMIGPEYRNVAYRAIRSSPSAPFGPAGRFAALGGISGSDLEMRDDELEIFFWSGLAQLAFAARPSTEVVFAVPTAMNISGFSPSLSGDSLALYFLDRVGELNVVRRQTTSSGWSSPIAVGISKPFALAAIDVARDELSLLIAAESDSVEAGIYVSRRSSLSDSFATPERIGALAGPLSNARFAASDTEIVFSAPFGGSLDLYRSRLVAE